VAQESIVKVQNQKVARQPKTHQLSLKILTTEF